MDAFGFVASVIGSLAWPAAVVVLAIIFQDDVRAMLKRLVRAKGPGVEVELAAQSAIIMSSLVAAGEEPQTVARGAETSRSARLAAIAADDPRRAIDLAWREVDQALNKVVTDAGVRPGSSDFSTNVTLAQEHHLLSDPMLGALRGLANMKLTIRYGPEETLTSSMALEIIALTDAVLSVLATDRPPAAPPPASG